MKASTDFSSSFVAAPSSVKPRGPYFFCMAIRMGISPRQGSHQVPQKFTSPTFPLKLASVTSFPCKSLNVTSGSSASAAGALVEPVDDDPPLQPENPSNTTENRTATRSVLTALFISIAPGIIAQTGSRTLDAAKAR